MYQWVQSYVPRYVYICRYVDIFPHKSDIVPTYEYTCWPPSTCPHTPAHLSAALLI